MSRRITGFSRPGRSEAQPHATDPSKASPLALLVRRFTKAPGGPSKASPARRGPIASKGTVRGRKFRHEGQLEDFDGEAAIEAFSSDQDDGEGNGERQRGWGADAATDGPSALPDGSIGRDRPTQEGPAAERVPSAPAQVWPIAKLVTAWKLRRDRSPALVDYASRAPSIAPGPAASVVYSPYRSSAAVDEGEFLDRRWRSAQHVDLYEPTPATLRLFPEPPPLRFQAFSPAAALPAARSSRLFRNAGVVPFQVREGEAPKTGRIVRTVVAAYHPLPERVTDAARPVPMLLRRSGERSRASILPYEASEQGRDAVAARGVKRSYRMPTPDILNRAEPRGAFAITGRSRTGSSPDDPVPTGPRSTAYRGT